MVAYTYKTIAVATASLLLSPVYSSSQSYDAIVVGAGPAGIIVAEKLASQKLNTLLLEKGGGSYYITGGRDRPDWVDTNTALSRVDIPGEYSSIFSGNAADLLCSDSNAFQACTIGGQSAINAGLFFHPTSEDFHVDTWGPDDFAGPIEHLLQNINGTSIPSPDGKLYVQSTYTTTKEWLDTAGYSEVDLNAVPNQKEKVYGHTIYDYNGNGQRGGPSVTYLQSALKNPSFTFRTNTTVAKILRDGCKATGIQTSSGENITLSANGFVVSSGGPLFTPALLYKSGIGPSNILESLSIPSSDRIVNENVGKNLYDNPNTFLLFSSDDVEMYNYTYDGITADKQTYLDSRTGPYAHPGQTMAFFDKVNGTYMQGTVGVAGYQDYTGEHDYTINIYGTAGIKSRGSVVLDSNGHPGPDGTVYYSNADDANAIAQYIYNLYQSLPQGITARNLPANATVEDIHKYITTGSAYAVGEVNHWGGSCKIAASTAEGGCVDLNAKVHGTDNIFVVDASIINDVLTANPQFGVMAYAELGSDKILAQMEKGVSSTKGRKLPSGH